VAAQNVSYRLIGQAVTIGQSSDDAVICPAVVLSRHSHHQASTSGATAGRPGYCRCLEPSNFLATSLRYQAKMVSGLATQATARSAFRPRRFPISASGALGMLNRNLDGRFALTIRFSAVRYSFCGRSSWFTYARSRAHVLFLMATAYLTLRRAV
jgi:hypothetical protein